MITCTSALTLSSYIHTPVHTISTHTSLPTRPTPSSVMFYGASAFNQIWCWDLSHNPNINSMFTDSPGSLACA